MFGNFNNSRGLNLWHISHPVIDVAQWKNLNSKRLVEEILGWWVVLSLFPENLQYSITIRYHIIQRATTWNNSFLKTITSGYFRGVWCNFQKNGGKWIQSFEVATKNHVENLCCFIPQSIFLWGPLQAPWCAMSTSLYTRRVIVGGASGIARSYCRSGAGNMAGFCYREGVRRWRLFCCGGCDLFLSSRLFVVDVLSRSCKFEFQNFMKRLLNNWKWAK